MFRYVRLCSMCFYFCPGFTLYRLDQGCTSVQPWHISKPQFVNLQTQICSVMWFKNSVPRTSLALSPWWHVPQSINLSFLWSVGYIDSHWDLDIIKCLHIKKVVISTSTSTYTYLPMYTVSVPPLLKISWIEGDAKWFF